MNVAQRLCLHRILNLCLEQASLKAWDYEAKGNKWTTFFAKIQIERKGGGARKLHKYIKLSIISALEIIPTNNDQKYILINIKSDEQYKTWYNSYE